MIGLGRIVSATFPATDLAAVAAAYRLLGFGQVGEGAIAEPLAQSWAAPAAAGARYVLLAPATGDDFVLRVVAGPQPPNFAPLRANGWAGLVLPAQGLAGLAGRLAGSGFAILDKLRDAAVAGANRPALQVQGPAGEVVTLVEPAEDAPLPGARGRVDRAVAAVLACAELERAFEFYQNKFMAEPAEERLVALWAVNKAFGFDRPSKHCTMVVTLPGASLIELQQYPDDVARRPTVPRHLAPGIALVTFEGPVSLEAVSVYSLTEPHAYEEAPYRGRRQMTFYGAAGEMIELLETA
jgi:hypothetical protein